MAQRNSRSNKTIDEYMHKRSNKWLQDKERAMAEEKDVEERKKRIKVKGCDHKTMA